MRFSNSGGGANPTTVIRNESILVTSPNGGETWNAGSTHNVTWVSDGIVNVKLEYSLDSGSTWTTITASTPAGAGSFAWTLPVTPSTTALVKVSDVANPATFDTSNAVFTIQKFVTLSAPTGGENWAEFSVQNITWTSGGVTNVKLEYSNDSGSTWTTIIASTAAGAGTYAWTIPVVADNGLVSKVRISDASDATTNNVSGLFTIAVFTPDTLSDLVFDGDATQYVTGNSLVNGDDMSSTGGDWNGVTVGTFSVVSGGKSPIMVVPAQNGRDAFNYDPAIAVVGQKPLDAGGNYLSGAVGATAFIVVKANATSGANNCPWDFEDRSGGKCVTNRTQYCKVADSKIYDGGFYSVLPSGTTPPSVVTSFRLVTIRVASNVYNLRMNGALIKSDSSGVFVNNTSLRLGLDCGSSAGFAGQLGDVYIYKRGLSDAEVAQMEAYINSLWALY